MNYIGTLIKYKTLLGELVMRDIKIRYRRSVLGMFWSVLNPLLMMTVILIVFSQLFKFQIPNYPVYLLCGQLIFNFFSEASNTSMTSIVDNGSLIRKVYIPKYIFPMSRVASSLVNMFFSLIALIVVLIITQTPIKLPVVLVPILIIYVLMFAFGMGLILSTITVFFRDIIHLYGVFLTAWMYFSALFYPVEILPEIGQRLIKLNPLYHYIRFFRTIVMDGLWPNLNMHMYCLVFGLVFAVVGSLIFQKYQYKFILHI